MDIIPFVFHSYFFVEDKALQNHQNMVMKILQEQNGSRCYKWNVMTTNSFNFSHFIVGASQNPTN